MPCGMLNGSFIDALMKTRYLVSQHFGRVTAQVTIDGLAGTVQLEFEIPRQRLVHYQFDTLRVQQVLRPGQDVAELAIRLAVAQARRLGLYVPGREICEPIALNLGVQPWLGDLTLEPFGGATTGIEALARTQSARRHQDRQERRSDKQTCKAVDRGLRLRNRQGEEAALDFLAQRGIPEHIVQRVVSDADSRRK